MRGAISIAVAVTAVIGGRRAAIYTTDFGGPLEPEAGRSRSAREGPLVALAVQAGG